MAELADITEASDNNDGETADRTRNRTTSAALRHGRKRIFVSIGALFGLFVLAAMLFSYMIGTPFTAPTENVSHAIGFSYVLPFSIGISGYFFIQLIAHLRQPGLVPLSERLSNVLADGFFLLLFAGVVYVHFQIKAWMPLINPVMYDELYFAIDEKLRWLLNGLGAIRGAIGGMSPRTDYLYQLGFLAMFAVSLWGHALGDRRWHFNNMYAILLLQMIGAFTYLIAPAVGPFVFEHGPNAAATEAQIKMLEAFRLVQEQGAAWLAVHGGDYFTGPPAAMPSLHTAGAIIISHYMIRARSVLAPFMVMMTSWILIESVVSRWHYIADLPPGLLLAIACIYISNRACRPVEEEDQPKEN